VTTTLPDPLEDDEPDHLELGAPAPVPDAPPPDLRFRRAFRFREAFAALWRSRAIVWSLTIRDLRSTYSQEVLGIAWALVAPVTLMVLFTFLSNRMTSQLAPGDVWYPLFAYIGILPWTFFSGSVSKGGTSLVGNPLLNKVYAPREVFPISDILGAIVNVFFASIALAVLFLIDGTWPASTSYWAIPLALILFVFTSGITLFIAGLTVYLRDMRHALPLILQGGLILSPIIYGMDKIPEQWRNLYVAINPLAGVIDGLRRSILYGRPPVASYTIIAAVVACVWLFFSFALFKRLETGFADVS
jgi:ABC-2 type transport system permease protein/lipopolysaccharide transport system permease protein